VLGSGSRSLRAGVPRRSPRRVALALVATAARMPGPPRAPRDGRVDRTPPGTGAAPRAADPRRRQTPRPLRSACESASPLGAPPLQNLPSALRRHPLAESVRLGAPATIRLKRPLHDVLLVRALRTARPSYRCANDGVKRSTRAARVWRGCRSREAHAMVGRPVPGGSAARARGARRSIVTDRIGTPSASGDDSNAPGVIHRRG
jgi:hypothetical protein